MISRRSFVLLRLALPVFGLTLAACDRATAPTQPTVRSGSATLDKKYVPKGTISARVLTNKAGVSVLEVRTGTFDNATNTGTPDGTFEEIKYTIYQNDPGKKPKKIFERKVSFKRSRPNFFSEVISICKKSDEDDPPCEHRDGRHYDDHYDHDDDHDGHGGSYYDHDDHDDHPPKPQPPCPLQVGKSYSISIEAELDGLGSNRKYEAEVRDTAIFFKNPDVDLSAEKVQLLITVSPPTATDQLLARVDVPNTYQVRFVNSSTTIGVRTTCEVHVFNSLNVEVPLVGRTYRWIPSGVPAYEATKTGSVASDTTTIKPGEQATCQFTMKLGPIGSYRIVVTANTVYPDDYDPSNNKVFGTASIIAEDPILPPAGGFEAFINTQDNAIFADYTVNSDGSLNYIGYLGDSAQFAKIDSLSSTIVDGNGLTGTFALTLDFYTVDSTAGQAAPGVRRNLASGIWSGDLAQLHALSKVAGLASGGLAPCVSSRASSSLATTGTFTAPAGANGNLLSLIVCIAPVGTNYKFSVSVLWTSPTSPPVPVSVANGAVSYGDFLFFDVDLNLSAFGRTRSHAPVELNSGRALTSTLGGKIARIRSK